MIVHTPSGGSTSTHTRPDRPVAICANLRTRSNHATKRHTRVQHAVVECQPQDNRAHKRAYTIHRSTTTATMPPSCGWGLWAHFQKRITINTASSGTTFWGNFPPSAPDKIPQGDPSCVSGVFVPLAGSLVCSGHRPLGPWSHSPPTGPQRYQSARSTPQALAPESPQSEKSVYGQRCKRLSTLGPTARQR